MISKSNQDFHQVSYKCRLTASTMFDNEYAAYKVLLSNVHFTQDWRPSRLSTL